MVKKAFSLIELLIVIVIIGVVYTMVIVKLDTAKEQERSVSLATLKDFLYTKLGDAHMAEIICFGTCKECVVYVGGEKVVKIEGLLDDSLELYKYDPLQGVLEYENPPFFDARGMQKDVCFRLRINKEKVSNQVIVQYKDKVYDFSSYFDSPRIYDSLEELSDYREKLYQEVR